MGFLPYKEPFTSARVGRCASGIGKDSNKSSADFPKGASSMGKTTITPSKAKSLLWDLTMSETEPSTNTSQWDVPASGTGKFSPATETTGHHRECPLGSSGVHCDLKLFQHVMISAACLQDSSHARRSLACCHGRAEQTSEACQIQCDQRQN